MESIVLKVLEHLLELFYWSFEKLVFFASGRRKYSSDIFMHENKVKYFKVPCDFFCFDGDGWSSNINWKSSEFNEINSYLFPPKLFFLIFLKGQGN